jgi:beta-glucosidase
VNKNRVFSRDASEGNGMDGRMYGSQRAWIFLGVAAIALAGFGNGSAQNATSGKSAAAVTGNARVDKLLSEMTLDEKITMIHGTSEDPATYQAQAGFMPGVARLGIPGLRLADGPPGLLTRVPSTAPTATMGLAATFSREDARQNGVVIAREARSHGIDVVLQPFINIDRDITFGRGYNTFGEDPVLTGQMGAAMIRGVQGEGILSQAKHYVAYDTDGTDVYVDQQALHEIYVAPFADASDAAVSSIMCSYNKINGEYACGNNSTLNKILKEEVGFKGFVTSDWGATHGTNFINNGLDMEMPGTLNTSWRGPAYFENQPPPPPHPPAARDAAPSDDAIKNALPEEPASKGWSGGNEPMPTTTLKTALQAGTVSEATITRAAGRVLLQMEKLGFLDGKSRHDLTPSAVEENAKVILKTGEDAAVLLKNEAGILPLKKADLASIAFIGPGAGQTIAVGQTGEKAVGLPEREIGAVDALKKLTASGASVHILYAVANDMMGTAVPAEFLSHDGKPGLERTAAKGTMPQIDAQLDFTRSNGKALPANSSFTWRGTLNAPSAGSYRLHLQVLGCYSDLRVDGKKIAANGQMWIHGDITQAGQDNILPTTDGLDNLRVDLNLTPGPHALAVSITPDSSNNPAQVRLSWVTPQQQAANYATAISAAKQAKTAVVFAWSRGKPDFSLPGDQDKLIADVAAVNPNTIVVLNVSQPVAMPWVNKVKAVLQMWWPGDEGGWATANILLGKTSPAGRLPFTWPVRLQDEAANDPAHPERTAAGVNGKTTFSEGIYVGYRWFDQQKIEPLFPFGFGLSYSHFDYSGLAIAPARDGGLEVSVRVTNNGSVASDDVPQVYLGAPDKAPAGAQFAVRALAGFDRVHLQPNQSQTVTVHVPLRRLQYWSTNDGKWATAVGPRTVYVGASSRDLRLHTTATISH